ncbi:MAG: RtcB family protein [Bryobacteraceae bacterium]
MEIQPIDSCRHRIPRDERRGMRTDVIVYASDNLLDQIRKDLSLEQAMNVATLPGIVGPSLAMPDIHQGYGFPIGGVVATDFQYGVVSPGGVGFDINCGVRLLRTSLKEGEVRRRLQPLMEQVFRDVPSGAGSTGPVKIGERQLDEVLLQGAYWMVLNGYGESRDVEFTEAGGALDEADPNMVSARAKQRGRTQLATLGGGNHFLEIQYVESVSDDEAAKALGIAAGQVVVLIHSGSRGLGHQVCTDYMAEMNRVMRRYEIAVPDRQLACAPIASPEGRSYLAAMAAAANFAWANRQGLTHFLRGAFGRIFGGGVRLDLVYDVGHNMANRERHIVNGRKRDVLVHRNGATRAFPPGHREIPAGYREVGQPVLAPGNMGAPSWILVGASGAMKETFGSVCHEAGRMMSRTAAPEAYKNGDEVIEVVHAAGLARKVARLAPMGVIKG